MRRRSRLRSLRVLRKLFITPWFGSLPPWMDQYLANAELLKPLGYDWLITTNLKRFRQRVGDLLGVKCPIEPGGGKLHDFRPALGLLYAQELRGYDYWGHTDFDCVYGRVDRFVTDDFLTKLDVHSNHENYICGPWTLYRNDPDLAALFMKHPEWKEMLENPHSSGWAEKGFTEILDAKYFSGNGKLNRQYTHWQTSKIGDTSDLTMQDDGTLLEGTKEVMMCHFRHTKEWPAGVTFA